MATVQINLGLVTALTLNGADLPIFDSVDAQAETLDSTAGNVVASKTGKRGYVWCITALDAIWVKFGAAPIATSGDGWLIGAGQTRTFKVTADGEKVAIKAAG
ncbi:hypothetical protein [Sphingomonas trueperi]|uniref:Uncharacterized protein n=1 Tax=Sphingomonas trueperi TaxID=53317 RepID=A0A7X6BE64_9SPHN|nr:hypothetical protein [Sphingomonas trueperi]NJB99859.1 hypothetical protein [Sphingomonas trueperi]